MARLTEYVATFAGVRWSSEDGSRIIGFTDTGEGLIGPGDNDRLIEGVTYCFYGKWGQSFNGRRQFEFKHFIQRATKTRHGVIAYLERFAPGIGPAIAAELWDLFGEDAVLILRRQPKRAAASIRFLCEEQACIAAEELEKHEHLEETRIALNDLFAGKGFPAKAIDEAIEKLGVKAPLAIKRDPFCLLVRKVKGCGFMRCDRLYCELGLPLSKLKRQMLCLWHSIREDGNGHTWFPGEAMARRLGELVTGATPAKAIKFGVRAGWLARRGDWLADAKKATNEEFVCERLTKLARYSLEPVK